MTLAATLLIALATPLFALLRLVFLRTADHGAVHGRRVTFIHRRAGRRYHRATSHFCRVVFGNYPVDSAHALPGGRRLSGRSGVGTRSQTSACAPRWCLVQSCRFSASPTIVRNQILFGNPLDFGYPTTVENGKQVLIFDTPIFRGLYGFLLSPGKSAFIFAPPILLALVGLKRLARLDRGLAFVAGVTPLVYLLFFSRYTLWEGGYRFGPRFLSGSGAVAALPRSRTDAGRCMVAEEIVGTARRSRAFCPRIYGPVDRHGHKLSRGPGQRQLLRCAI